MAVADGKILTRNSSIAGKSLQQHSDEEKGYIQMHFASLTNLADFSYLNMIPVLKGDVKPLDNGKGTHKNRYFERSRIGRMSSKDGWELNSNDSSSYQETEYDVELQGYDGNIKFSSLLDMTSKFNKKMDAFDELDNSWILTVNHVIREALFNSTSSKGRVVSNRIYGRDGGNALNSIANTEKINLEMLLTAQKTLETGKAQKIKEFINPSDWVSTRGVESSYVLLTGYDAEYDLKAISGFQTVDQYPAGMEAIMPGEYGRYDRVRCILDPEMKNMGGVGTGGTNVMGAVMLGAEAFTFDYLNGMLFDYRILDKADKSDIHNKEIVCALNCILGASIRRQQAVVNLFHAGDQ